MSCLCGTGRFVQVRRELCAVLQTDETAGIGKDHEQ